MQHISLICTAADGLGSLGQADSPGRANKKPIHKSQLRWVWASQVPLSLADMPLGEIPLADTPLVTKHKSTGFGRVWSLRHGLVYCWHAQS